MAALGKLADVPTPTIDALINLSGLSLGIDYAKMGLRWRSSGSPESLRPKLARFVHDGA